MLCYPNALEAVRFREVDFPKRLLDKLAVGRSAPARKELEDANVHLKELICAVAFPATQVQNRSRPSSRIAFRGTIA